MIVPAKVRSENVTTPATAFLVTLPPSVPPLAVTSTASVDDVTTLSPASSTLTMGCVARSAPALEPTGCRVICTCVGSPIDTVNVAESTGCSPNEENERR